MKLHSGDIILFRGTGFISWLICWAAMIFGKKGFIFGGDGQVFSHIGMVVHSEDMSSKFRKEYNLRRHVTYMTESTSISRCYDVFGRKVSGVQLVKLEDKIDQYKGKCFVRTIHPGLSQENKRQLERNIRKFYGPDKNTPYEKSRLSLAMAQLDMTNIELAEDLTSLFCSEWVAYHYVSFGWLKGKLNEFTPTDFGNGIELLKQRKLNYVKRI